jgi:hypothetical protein
MRVRRALLDPADMQRGGPEVHLLPSQVYQFGRAKTVAVGHEDHRGVPVPPAALPGRIHQPPDLGLGQVLAGTELAVRGPLRSNCSVYDGWRDQPEVPLGHVFRAPRPDDCPYNERFTNSMFNLEGDEAGPVGGRYGSPIRLTPHKKTPSPDFKNWE